MRNWIGTIVTAVIAAVLALLAVPSPEAVAGDPPARLPAYAYDGVHGPVVATSDAFDRGPPVRASAASTYDAFDRWSRGASARPDGPPPGATTTYTIPAQFAHVTRAMTTTGLHVVVADGGFSARPVASVAAKTADDWPVISGIVRDASRSKGNFGLGSGTASQATRAGESWVGEGYRIASDGKTLVSRDGLRVFRPPSWKPNLGKYQANFEYWVEGQVTRKPIGNGHFDVTDMVR